jgi:hypothetical protein
MSNGGTDIIIKGSSIDITFDDSVYLGAGHGSHKGQRKMQRILVVDDQEQVQYDSQSADVKKWTVTVLTGNE